MEKYVNGFWVQKDDYFFDMMSNSEFPLDGKLHNELLDLIDIKNFRNCLDIGAHIGIWSKVLSKRFDNVYSFEPSKSNCYFFEKNLENTKNVFLNNCAIYDTDDNQVNITQLVENNFGSYCLTESGYEKEFDVITKKIDSLNLTDIDFIQLHTKGCEYQVLKGSEKTLMKFKPVLVFQIYDDQLKLFSSSSNEIINYLKTFGYKIYESNLFQKWGVKYQIGINR
jgi:FkbM family methyltransferase